jgi:hypothetical protein
MKKRQNLETKILNRINRKSGNVFLRKDFEDLGGYDQVGRALKNLEKKTGKIMRVGYGLYSKAEISTISGELLPMDNLPNLGKEALRRLNIEALPSKADLAYYEGRSTQVPTGRLIGVKSRIRRKIGYKGFSIKYERVS